MKTAILRPTIGQKIRSEEVGITGRVVDIYTYEDVHGQANPTEQAQINQALRDQLGDDFKNLFFEVVVRVTYGRKASDYVKGELAILSWQEFQKVLTL